MTKLLLILPHTTELNSYLATVFKNRYKECGIKLLKDNANYIKQIQKTNSKVVIVDERFCTLEIKEIANKRGITLFVQDSTPLHCTFSKAFETAFKKKTYYYVNGQFDIKSIELDELDLIHRNNVDYFIDIPSAEKSRLEKIQSRIIMCKNNIIHSNNVMKSEQALLSELLGQLH